MAFDGQSKPNTVLGVARDEQIKLLENRLHAAESRAYWAEQHADRSLRTTSELVAQAEARANMVEQEAAEAISNLQAELQEVKQQLRKTEETLDTERHLVLKTKADNAWAPRSNEEIGAQMDIMLYNIRSWSETWADRYFISTPTIGEILVSTQFSQFIRLFKERTLPEMLNTLCFVDEHKVPAALLTALLAHWIHLVFFEDRFCCFDESEQSALTNTFALMAAVDEREAHIWRSSLWRLMCDPEKGRLRYGNRDKTWQDLKASYAAIFMRGDAEYLLTDLGNNEDRQNRRTTELEYILDRAMSLSKDLWSQRYDFEKIDLNLVTERKAKFKSGSPFLELDLHYQTSNNESHEEEAEILMVLRPALLAFNLDVESDIKANKPRVLAKAVVVLDKNITYYID